MNNVTLTGFGDKENRREHDYYPTPPECTIALMEFLKLSSGSKIWECACGNGYISKVLKSYDMQVYSSDLNTYPYDDADYGIDYLKQKPKCDYDAIITNPPFKQSVDFIKKAVKEAPVVAMMLKSQYWHAERRYSLFMASPPAYVLPLTWRPNFDQTKGKAPTMEVYWTVWMEGDTITKYIPLLKPDLKKLITQ